LPGSAANDAARVRAALDAAADGQLDAAGLADRLTASTRAEPLLGAPARRPKPTSHRRVPTRQPRRGLAAMSVALVAVGAFIVIGALSRAPADVSAPHALGSIASAGAVAPVAAAVPVDWLAVVTRLTAMRTTAIVTGKPSLLRRVYVDGAAAAAADVELVRRWQLQQTRVVGFDAAVVSVDLLRSTVDTAVLDVTTELSAYRVVDRRGLAVSRSAAQQQSVQLVLVRRGERWLVRHVRAVEPQSTSAATAASTSS
jgi:hypothetical protein